VDPLASRTNSNAMTKPPLPHLRLGTGVPLVVIPGLSGRIGVPFRIATWMQRQEIAEFSLSRAVWSIDRRRGMDRQVLVSDLAEEYAATLRNLFDGPVDIVGVSTGGGIALQLAVDSPELVRRLVLVSSAYRLSDVGRSIQQAIASRLRSGRPRRAAALFLANTGATRTRRALLGVVGALAPRLVVGQNDSDLLTTLDAEENFDLVDRVGDIAMPTLVTGGGNDRFYTADLFKDTAARIPNSTLRIYPRAGHISTHGNRRLVRDILTFLESDQPAGPANDRANG
jgi:pimeloyl-ACP methyl ester carboxylesterase